MYSIEKEDEYVFTRNFYSDEERGKFTLLSRIIV
jgi:hypothetical protein